jgi:hypothetical protein
MASIGCYAASASHQPDGEPQQLVDTDMELSDYPDNLSECSQAQGDVLAKQRARTEYGAQVQAYALAVEEPHIEQHEQAKQEVQMEQHAHAEQESGVELEAQMELDVETGQANEDTQPSPQEPETWAENLERTGLVVQASVHSIESVPGPVHDTPQKQNLPSPPRSQASGDDTRLPPSPMSDTPKAAATAPIPHDLPSPTSVNHSPSLHLSNTKKTRHRRTIEKLRKTGKSTCLVSTRPSTSTFLRRSERKIQPPPRFPGMGFPSPSPEPSPAPEPTRQSKIVVLKLNSALLNQVGKPEPATTEAPNPTKSLKRKRTPRDPKPATKKKSRKSNDDDQEALLPDIQSQDTAVLSSYNDLPPSKSAEALLSSSMSTDYGTSAEIWSIGERLMENAQPPVGHERQAPVLESHGKPPAWGSTRFAIAETLVNCLMYQSGSYTKDGLAFSYCYGNITVPRSYIDEDVFIARAPGGMGLDPKTQQRCLAKDQTENSETKAFRNAVQAENPILLITKDNNALMPSRMPHPYNVLGHFKATHIWWEKQKMMPGSKKPYKCAMFRFERLNPQREKAWYQPKGKDDAIPLGSLDRPVVAHCSSCRKASLQVYCQGWICLQRDCLAFWKLPTPSGDLGEVNEDTLVYDPRFVKQRTPWQQEDLQFPVSYNPMEISEFTRPEDLYTTMGWRGILCPQCYGCIMRLKFSGWFCDTPNCGYQRLAPQNIMPASSIVDPIPSFPRTNGYTPSRDIAHGNILVAKPLYANNYRMNRWDVLGAGFIVHAIANETICKEPGGPDDMLIELQREDIGLERRALGSEKLLDPAFTRHMNFNVGMYYKFAATGRQKSVSFEDAKAQAIRDVRTRLNWMMVQILARDQNKSIVQVGKEWEKSQFNEELILGYFEDQGIGYHDDGEPGLGPNIATLSLGDTGRMTIRMKAVHYFGRTKAGIYIHEHPPIPGCLKYEERLARHNQILRDAPAKNATGYYKQVAIDLGLKEFSERGGPIVLEMVLRHGDLVYMVGGDIQTYYEHSVTHEGRMRFALTCRTIDPHSIAASNRPDFEVGPDTGHYDGTKLPLPRDAAGNPIPNGWKWEFDDGYASYVEEVEEATRLDHSVESGGDEEEV